MTEDRTATVLIVDDEELLLDSYAAMLETRYEVQTAQSGEAALATVDEATDVVLLDRRMPDRSGEVILQEIRERGLECQVLFCSAVDPGVDLIPLEPDGYLHKPVGTDELFAEIETQLQIAGRAPSVQEYLRLERIQSILETNRSRSRLESEEAYQKLLEQVEQRKRAVDSSKHSIPAI